MSVFRFRQHSNHSYGHSLEKTEHWEHNISFLPFPRKSCELGVPTQWSGTLPRGVTVWEERGSDFSTSFGVAGFSFSWSAGDPQLVSGFLTWGIGPCLVELVYL